MEKLIEQYIELAVRHGEYILDGKSIDGNKIHSRVMKIINQIKLESQEVHHLFFKTLEHKIDSVRIWTATTLLKTKETESLAVLKQIAETNKSIHGLTAETIIDCWKRGILTDLTSWNK